MKIAVTSQNRREVTGHARRCRKFWIFAVEGETVVDKQLLEVPKEQSFHDSSPGVAQPLEDIRVLISGGMGEGLVRRLGKHGIDALITSEDNS